uniref:ANK_REP_REGION domain-containing protein n=1 Tax=Romanomermis culicivorax TaxID=13658 RepID=A0A915IF87_ROMCU
MPNVDFTRKDVDGYTALMHAAENGHDKILIILLKAFRKFDKKHSKLSRVSSASTNASASGERKASGNSFSSLNSRYFENPALLTNNNPSDSPDAVVPLDLLFPSDAVLNAKNHLGFTACDLAIRSGHLECAQLLELEHSRRLQELRKKLYSNSHTKLKPVASSLSNDDFDKCEEDREVMLVGKNSPKNQQQQIATTNLAINIMQHNERATFWQKINRRFSGGPALAEIPNKPRSDSSANNRKSVDILKLSSTMDFALLHKKKQTISQKLANFFARRNSACSAKMQPQSTTTAETLATVNCQKFTALFNNNNNPTNATDKGATNFLFLMTTDNGDMDPTGTGSLASSTPPKIKSKISDGATSADVRPLLAKTVNYLPDIGILPRPVVPLKPILAPIELKKAAVKHGSFT